MFHVLKDSQYAEKDVNMHL